MRSPRWPTIRVPTNANCGDAALSRASRRPLVRWSLLCFVGVVVAVGIFAVLSFLWVKLVMKRGLFEPTVPVVRPPSP